ncbi:MAG: MFS transporter [Myxococcales bacterium]|nr:MFS transporter [Myxococcales bacterium]
MNRLVRTYLASRFFAATAMTAIRAAIGWHVFRLTGSELLLGVVGVVQFVPAVIGSLSGGVTADRINRTAIVRVAQLCAVVVSPVLLGATLADHVSVHGLLLAAGLLAATAAFEQPARASILVSLVPRDEFPVAVTRAATLQALAFATGPALAGLLIAWRGAAAVYAAHALLLAASVVLVSMLPALRPPSTGPRRVADDLREGLRFVLANRVVLGCMAIDMFAVILGGATALLPVFAEEVLNVGPRGFGALSSSLEVGALTTALVLAATRPIRRAGRALLIAVALYGIATIVFGMSKWMPLSLVAYGLVGAADQVSVVLRHTVVQMATPDEVRGRVSSINMLFIQASNQLGAFESGALASVVGAPAAVVIGGVGAIVVAAVFAIRFPRLRACTVDATP